MFILSIKKVSNTFPNTTDILSVTYYDDYDFKNDGTDDYSFSSQLNIPTSTWFKRTKGKLIGTKVKVLNGASTPTWLHTITFYDKYGRVIQVKGQTCQNIFQKNNHYLSVIYKFLFS